MSEKTIELVDLIKILDLKTEDEGRAFWDAIASRNVYFGGVRVETGSFIFNAGQIARILEGNYRTYYYYHGSSKARKRIAKLFIDHLVTTIPYAPHEPQIYQ